MIARAIAAAALLATIGASPARAQGTTGGGDLDPATGAVRPDGGAPAPTAPAPIDGRASRRPEAVDITLVGSADAYAGLRARVGDRLPLGVPLLWNRIDRFNPLTELLRGPPAPQPTSSTLRCWIDLADLRRATLYFADQRGERFLVRELPLSGRFDEVDQQSVAQVMELSVSALIENAEIGFSRAQAREIFERAQPPAPVAVAAAPPAEAPRWHLAAGIFYALEALGDALPFAHGPGVILTLGRGAGAPGSGAAAGEGATRVAPGIGAWLAGGYQIPIQARQPDVGLRLESLGVRVGADARWWRLQLRLGAGANFTHVMPQPGSDTPTTILASPHWSTGFVATGALVFRLPFERAFGPLLALSVALFIDAAPSTTEYRFADATGNHVAFAPRRLRPGLALQLAY